MPIYQIKDRKPVISDSAWVAPSAEIIGDVRIGKHCYIGWGAILRGDYGTITIGDESAIEEGVIIHARPMDKTVIGIRVTVGHGVMIHNAVIRDYATIGMRATVSDFSEIGEWSLVGEQALVARRQIIPPGKIYAGVPAREIGDMKEKTKTEWTWAKQIYVDLAKQYRTDCSIIE
ncbi:MAG: gamma carbonic anhydrase family protein [Spirochaetes bacterium]|nr:gamma carbonic anhydrase family protein [Spirochaetota bacterium]